MLALFANQVLCFSPSFFGGAIETERHDRLNHQSFTFMYTLQLLCSTHSVLLAGDILSIIYIYIYLFEISPNILLGTIF